MRSSGVLMHISSLPSPYGIGTMGKEARKFVDFLVKAKQSYWQVLPICPTSYGDSPYQSFSSFAGNPYFIDLEKLCSERLLTKKECQACHWGKNPAEVDYGVLYQNRYPLLHKAFARFQKKIPESYWEFCREQEDWLEDYALFMALKDTHEGKAWMEWEQELKERRPDAMARVKEDLAEEISFWKMLQYLFYQQWEELKSYANGHGIRIIGDVPIYVAMDSADVWAAPSQFYLNGALEPIDVAGCPPDAFSDDGQLWGNPLFRWDVMEQDNYRWWTKRLSKMSKLFDVVRIDHFRGFDEYYSIPYGAESAKEGHWEKGPGIDLFRHVEQSLGWHEVIAEDLGYVTDSVRQLVFESGFPGMKVLEFAFDSRDTGSANDYLPHNYIENCVAYTGTHDNETITGWFQSITKKERQMARDYLCDQTTPDRLLHQSFISLIMRSSAKSCIIPIQDYMGYDNTCRINKPSTVGINWRWRLTEDELSEELKEKIHAMAMRYGRKNWN